MFPVNPKYLVLDDAEKMEKTEKYFESTGIKRDRILKETKELEQLIDEKLTLSVDKKEDEFLKLLHDEQYEECRKLSYDFSCLKFFDMAAQMEKQNRSNVSICFQNSFEDMKWSYQGLVFYLRRIEFDFPVEEQSEIFSFMRQRGLSEYYLYCVFMSAVIKDKCKVAFGLSKLFNLVIDTLWEDFYIEWLVDNCRKTNNILMTLASRLLELGNASKALEAIEKIEKPNDEIVAMKNSLKANLEKKRME